jgi:hypothetical protein
MLTEACTVTGYHRKSLVRRLNAEPVPRARRVGRPRQYGVAVASLLKAVWEATDHLGSKRLAPFLGEALEVLHRAGELVTSEEARQALITLSPATIDRLLAPERRRGRESRRPATPTLKQQIPLRTFGDWKNVEPGAVQADLVLHCGESVEGFYLTTLAMVDVASGWQEYEVIWGKGEQRVYAGLHAARQRLPFPLRELHTDNGSEFINLLLYPWCQKQGVRFSRGRPYKKNDQAFVEQRNWSGVRKPIGYDRLTSKESLALLRQYYTLHRTYMNFFQPIRKTLRKERQGAKLVIRYSPPQTPYQRLRASGCLAPAAAEALERQYQSLSPLTLLKQCEQILDSLWESAKVTKPSPAPATVAIKARDLALLQRIAGAK